MAQVAAVQALREPAYYARRYAETHALRADLGAALATLGMEVVPGVANFLLCHLPANAPDAATIVARCRARGLFLRDVGSMGRHLGRHALRIAVKDAATQRRMIEILADVLARGQAERRAAALQRVAPLFAEPERFGLKPGSATVPVAAVGVPPAAVRGTPQQTPGGRPEDLFSARGRKRRTGRPRSSLSSGVVPGEEA
jgi:hypothetical protein